MICLTIVFELGRLKIVESLELMLGPRLHSVSNRTTHFRVLIQAVTSGGRYGINMDEAELTGNRTQTLEL